MQVITFYDMVYQTIVWCTFGALIIAIAAIVDELIDRHIASRHLMEALMRLPTGHYSAEQLSQASDVSIDLATLTLRRLAHKNHIGADGHGYVLIGRSYRKFNQYPRSRGRIVKR